MSAPKITYFNFDGRSCKVQWLDSGWELYIYYAHPPWNHISTQSFGTAHWVQLSANYHVDHDLAEEFWSLREACGAWWSNYQEMCPLYEFLQKMGFVIK